MEDIERMETISRNYKSCNTTSSKDDDTSLDEYNKEVTRTSNEVMD